MDEKGIWLQFIVEIKTEPGQDIYIVGNNDKLSKWDAYNGVKLNTGNYDHEKHPIWQTHLIEFDKNVQLIEYKFIIRDTRNSTPKDKEIIWEDFGPNINRKLDLSKFEDSCLVIDNGLFSKELESKILTLEQFNKKLNNNKEDFNNNNKEINNNHINHIEEKKENENFNEIKLQETNKIGLQNIGSTCYMNATLQCFCHIGSFISYFKKLPLNNLSQDSLSISFKNLIDHIWSEDLSPNHSENNYYIPTDFRKKIANKSPLFQNNVANDAKDLVNFIIMTLHEELNEYKANKNNYQNVVMINQYNKQLVYDNFIKEYYQNNNSIISKIFYAINLSETQCSFCRNILYNYQIYYFIVFPLEEVRKFKYEQNFLKNNFNIYQAYNQINNYNNIPKEVSIYDCFDYDKKINNMIGQNQMYCNYCKANTNSTMVTKLITGPEILILLLNRGKGLEFDVKINFVEYLNLEKYIENKNTGYYYELLGVITHIGENGQGGHFIAYCRDPFTNVWSKYNDAIVTEVNDFKKDILDFANPYLLFYQKLKT